MTITVQKVLGQAALAATTLTDVYTVPSGKQAVVSTITVSNNSSSATSFRIAVAVAGLADTAKQYLYYDVTLAGNDTFAATLGITLGSTDVIRAYAGAATVAVNIFGSEITP